VEVPIGEATLGVAVDPFGTVAVVVVAVGEAMFCAPAESTGKLGMALAGFAATAVLGGLKLGLASVFVAVFVAVMLPGNGKLLGG
jgi:hypothetical protein